MTSEEIFPDEEGLEFSTIEKVQEEPARSLADMARDAVRALGGDGQKLSIEVRDDSGPVLHLKFTFAVERRRH
ncbi:hypothetical protein [Bradyrhizobium sp. I1.7.5]|uniref:DUF6894 family protein n=1 Tax=Bradyrhizobium sp. I1.7.5 TaxID=3156363 RepID=UPI0033964038